MSQFDLQELTNKQRKLAEIKSQLKSEFFGLDRIIDRVVDSLYAWYLFPQLITRPVVVNLWGMTGVGKTQLVRRLVTELGMYDKFVEVQMDGLSGGSGYSMSSISAILASSSIEEGDRGIVLLDEIQRFRTIDERGEDLKVERFQDVWMLLSDGRMAASSSLFRDIEDMLTYRLWSEEERNQEAVSNKPSKKDKAAPKYSIGPWEAQNLKKTLRLRESVEEIMTWNNAKVMLTLEKARSSRQNWEMDYSKLLIFVSGNLDEAFTGSESIDDCDTDADVYHELTCSITQADIKQALKHRFRPEQIARLGSNHVIYPSLSKDSYQKLIKHICDKYVKEMSDLSGINFDVDPQVYAEIYDNAVYPTQGTRPVFSSTHKIFSSALSSIAVWAIERGHTQVSLSIDAEASLLVGLSKEDRIGVQVDLDIRTTRKLNTQDFNTLVAVHEAGHALVYALLMHEPPQEVKINLARFRGGYMIRQMDAHKFSTREQILSQIAISLAGSAAEEVVFGNNRRSDGCGSDLYQATRMAHVFVREMGMGSRFGKISGAVGSETVWNTDLAMSGREMEGILQDQKKLVLNLIEKNRHLLIQIVEELLASKRISEEKFLEMFQESMSLSLNGSDEPFGDLWAEWHKQEMVCS